MTTQQYHIDGMSCAACSSAVERVTRKLNGVESSNVNLTTNRMVITYDESQVTPEMICEKVSKAGFFCQPDCGGRTEQEKGRRGMAAAGGNNWRL